MFKKNRVKIGLIFTLDYEIHGNGSGEFENWAYLPTKQMINLFEEFGAKLTIMAEMGHYWAMQKNRTLFCKEIDLFESQLKEAVGKGHDVQLHFHPQWIDAKYEEGVWHLDFSKKTIDRLCHNYEEALFYLVKGKTELENLLTPVTSDYKCISFRAGFLQIQPSEKMIKALVDAGFKSDTSVSKGMKYDNEFISIDFSSACSSYHPWKILNSDICKNNEDGILFEFPILSSYSGIKEKIINKIRSLKKRKNIDEIISQFMSVQSKWLMTSGRSIPFSNKLKLWMSKRWFYIDFCCRSHSDLVKDLKKVISNIKKDGNVDFIPIVLIGHSKDFFFANNLRSFLKVCQGIEEVEFFTYSGALEKYIHENNK